MDQLRSVLASINTALGGMTATQKLLIGSLAVIALMTLLLVSQYSISPSRVVVIPSGSSPEDQQAASAHLRTLGVEAAIDSEGNLVVPRASEQRALSMLAEAQLIPGDAALMFETLIERQSWQNSRSMNQQQFIIALQNELGRAIAGFTGIRDATVIIDDPEPGGLGRGSRPASASVAVTGAGSGGLDQDTVDAIAHLVASSRARLDVTGVRVIDRASNTQHGATDAKGLRATTYLEHKVAYENLLIERLYSQLRYIPNVIISVTASVDVTQVESQFSLVLPDKDGSMMGQIASETDNKESIKGGSAAGEPGLRSNTTGDINSAGSGSEQSSEKTDSERTFQHFPGTEQRRVVDPRGGAKYLAASISVPEEYITQLVRQASGAGAAPAEGDGEAGPAPVDPADVEAKFAEVKQIIIDGVFPHLMTESTPANPSTEELERTVHVSMVPTGFATASMLPPAPGGLPGVGGGFMALGGDLVDTVVVALLAIAALGMMVSVVRRSTKKLELPTAEELVGIPPALETMSEIVGEVEESVSAMEAGEVDDDTVEHDQILQQVTDLLKQSPEGSAKLLNRWMAADD